MKRKNFTFATYCAGIHKGAGTIPLLTHNHKRKAQLHRLRQGLKKSLQGSQIVRAGAAACLAIALLLPASAQQSCKTFQDADAANPIKKLLHGSEEIDGLDFVDIDADGDLDCYAKIYSDETYIPAIPILFRNIGTNTMPVYKRDANTGFATTNDGFYSLADIQFADMDGDGDYDCFIGENYGIGGALGGTTIHYYQNQGTPRQPKFVENEAANPVGFAYAFYGITFAIADIDNDGDYDLSYSANYVCYTYLNTGNKTQPKFNRYSIRSNRFFTREYYDWNKDGLPDHVDNSFGSLEEYRNLGPKEAPKYKLDNANGPVFNNGIPYRFVDLNNDGFPEVFNFNGGYSTTAPVAVIKATPQQTGSVSYTLLSSANQSSNYTYQWQLNGADIPNATKPSYPATRKGKYTLMVTGACGTGISLPYVITPGAQSNGELITGNITGVHSSVRMQASPNPFINTVTLRLAQPVSGNGSLIKVCDMQGRVLLNRQSSDVVISLGETLSRGIYIIQVWQKDGLVFSQKIIKE